jgi:hypothetical protein
MKNPDVEFTESPSSTVQLPPCKILTRLVENPGADVTQRVAEGGNSDDEETGGVECSKAHNMLMQFATIEEKLGVISQALEEGCVKKAGGGCRVRHDALWKVIERCHLIENICITIFIAVLQVLCSKICSRQSRLMTFSR